MGIIKYPGEVPQTLFYLQRNAAKKHTFTVIGENKTAHTLRFEAYQYPGQSGGMDIDVVLTNPSLIDGDSVWDIDIPDSATGVNWTYGYWHIWNDNEATPEAMGRLIINPTNK